MMSENRNAKNAKNTTEARTASRARSSEENTA